MLQNPFISGFADALTPPDTRLPTEWAADNLVIAHSERIAGKFQPDYAPWLIRPIDCLADPNVWASTLLKPVQGGGTQALEVYTLWRLANDPRPAIITGQTDKDVELLVLDKFLKTIMASPKLRTLVDNLPKDAIRRDRMDFPLMPIDIQGPGGNKIQSKTRPILICDEAWKYASGVMSMLLKRADAVTGKKVFTVSQASQQIGETAGSEPIWDDFGSHWHQGSQESFCVACPSCKTYHSLETHTKGDDGETDCGMIWDGRNADTGRWNLREVKATTRWRCPSCYEEHHPGKTTDERQAYQKKMSSDFVWVVENEEYAQPGHCSFRYSVWSVWWKDWGDMAVEYLLAKNKLRAGDLADYKNWIQQRETKFWTFKHTEIPVVNTRPPSGYTMEEYTPEELPVHEDGKPKPKIKEAPLIPGETSRHMSADVQKDHYKIVIRANAPGLTRQLLHTTVTTWEEIRELQVRYRVPDAYTVIDCGNWSQEVVKECARYNWLALRGADIDGFSHKRKRGRPENLPYSVQIKARDTTSKASFAWKFDWSNKRIKDMLSRLHAGITENITWELPDDMDDEMVAAMESERKDPKTGRWVKIGSRPNHYWDCECMILVNMMLAGELNLDVDLYEEIDEESKV
tara:strand:+ start:1306 stop:3198 length:1893 start_codon:yes stop_codon:yes gene_type:complete